MPTDDLPELPSWHDNLIYGLHLQTADPDRGLWRSNLLLDIDHIVEWMSNGEGGFVFRVAPATLTFSYVTDLRIAVDFGKSDGTMTLNELSIDQITREAHSKPTRPGTVPTFTWVIALNVPKAGEISFGATGYTQTLRAAPALCQEQRLPVADERPPMMVSGGSAG